MAYDRYDARDTARDERSRWRDDRSEARGGRRDRGFFERAGDEIASWFGDDDAERRRDRDERMEGRGRDRSWGRDDESARVPGLARGPQPMFGGYTASDGPPSGYSGNRPRGDFGERGSTSHDPHYHAWRQ